jgi:hypothetical protein
MILEIDPISFKNIYGIDVLDYIFEYSSYRWPNVLAQEYEERVRLDFDLYVVGRDSHLLEFAGGDIHIQRLQRGYNYIIQECRIISDACMKAMMFGALYDIGYRSISIEDAWDYAFDFPEGSTCD